MSVKRRDFIKGCATACVLLVPGVAVAAKVADLNDAVTPDSDLQIRKSIMASFGGGFSVQAHSQSDGLTYADIEHFGTRYSVASADLLDWEIVASL